MPKKRTGKPIFLVLIAIFFIASLVVTYLYLRENKTPNLSISKKDEMINSAERRLISGNVIDIGNNSIKVDDSISKKEVTADINSLTKFSRRTDGGNTGNSSELKDLKKDMSINIHVYVDPQNGDNVAELIEIMQ